MFTQAAISGSNHLPHHFNTCPHTCTTQATSHAVSWTYHSGHPEIPSYKHLDTPGTRLPRNSSIKRDSYDAGPSMRLLNSSHQCAAPGPRLAYGSTPASPPCLALSLQGTCSPWVPFSSSAYATSGWSSSPAGRRMPLTSSQSGWWPSAAQVCGGWLRAGEGAHSCGKQLGRSASVLVLLARGWLPWP